MTPKPQVRKGNSERRVQPEPQRSPLPAASTVPATLNPPNRAIANGRPSLFERAVAADDLREARQIEAGIDRLNERDRKLDGALARLLRTRLHLHIEDYEDCERPAPGRVLYEGVVFFVREELDGAHWVHELYLEATCEICANPFEVPIEVEADLGRWIKRSERGTFCSRHVVPYPGLRPHTETASVRERALADCSRG